MRRMPTAERVARENNATKPKSDKAHASIALVSFLWFAASRPGARNDSRVSYFRPTTEGAQGSAGVVSGAGVVVTVVTITLQHVALLHSPFSQTVSPLLVENPSGHAKLSQVGAGVVVTVVAMTLQHISLLHSPLPQTASPWLLANPSGHVKLAQVGALQHVAT